jgi:hypothetical protein
MKRATLAVLCLLALVSLAVASSETKGITARDVAGKPDVFCKVVKEPDPAFLGGWKCVHRRYSMKLHNYVTEPVQYWLVKVGDRYALYLFREKPGVKTYRGWREYTINGSEMTSKSGMKFSVRDGDVHYSWEGDKPTRMTRIEGS